ncbi:hypothetical protein Hdeb2414_s0009g00314291 [Helianthus debilis subsp. tardiflorus]
MSSYHFQLLTTHVERERLQLRSREREREIPGLRNPTWSSSIPPANYWFRTRDLGFRRLL